SRRATARAVADSARSVPHATAFRTADLTAALESLQRLREDDAHRGARGTPLLLVAKAAVAALRRHPALNSAWDEESGSVIGHDRIDLGIAVAVPIGLTVPHIRDAGCIWSTALCAEL